MEVWTGLRLCLAKGMNLHDSGGVAMGMGIAHFNMDGAMRSSLSTSSSSREVRIRVPTFCCRLF